MAILEAMIVAMISLNGSQWIGADNTRQSVQFSDQNVFGNAGCNQFNGAYKQTKKGLTVSSLATTRKACAPDVMLQESWFIQKLQQAKSGEIAGDTLTLKDAGGQIILRFSRKEQG
jgi:heat shock protein HslJ